MAIITPKKSSMRPLPNVKNKTINFVAIQENWFFTFTKILRFIYFHTSLEFLSSFSFALPLFNITLINQHIKSYPKIFAFIFFLSLKLFISFGIGSKSKVSNMLYHYFQHNKKPNVFEFYHIHQHLLGTHHPSW